MKKRGHGVLLSVNEKNRAKCAMETPCSKSDARTGQRRPRTCFYVVTEKRTRQPEKNACLREAMNKESRPSVLQVGGL
jgi:hypothetical protein